jgi:peptidoglycan endopeptidase LytE
MLQGCGTTKGSHAKTSDTGTVKSEAKEAETIFPPPVPGTTPEKMPAAKTTTYIVAKGDTLSLIAHKFKLSVAEIKALNKIEDSSKLREGQKLVLPGEVNVGPVVPPASVKKTMPSVSKSKTDVARSVAPPPSTAGETYVVKTGDGLTKIAKAHGTSVEAIRRANNLKGDTIRVGQKLVIPASGAAKKEAVVPAEVPATGMKDQTIAPIAPSRSAVTETPAESAADLLQPGDSSAQKTTDPASAGAIRIHTVAAGEDLDSVAMTWAVSVAEIKKLNGLTDEAIKPGQRLKIPLTE